MAATRNRLATETRNFGDSRLVGWFQSTAWNGGGSAVDITRWMDVLLQRAEVTGAEGEVPVAAVILDGQGKAIAMDATAARTHGPSWSCRTCGATAGGGGAGDWRFNACTLIVTLEPCPMCAEPGASADGNSGLAPRPQARGPGGSLDLSTHSSAHHYMRVIRGVRETEAKGQLAWSGSGGERTAEPQQLGFEQVE